MTDLFGDPVIGATVKENGTQNGKKCRTNRANV